ncbi:MAG: CmcI family methyltransferase [Saprospiraceae bacterium]
MDAIQQFEIDRKERVSKFGTNDELKAAAHQFNVISNRDQYSYNFSWMGRPIIQYPQDMIAMQKLIYQIKPDLIIETGIAHGGSLIYYASIMEMIGKGRVLGIDIDIREQYKRDIENHSMFKRIKMIQGSSLDKSLVDRVGQEIVQNEIVMVLLDSNHTYEHVSAELKLYSKFVTVGSYLVVFDTIIEDMPKGMYERPWDVGKNAKTAVYEFLKENDSFEIDHQMDNKLLMSVAPQGYLTRIK